MSDRDDRQAAIGAWAFETFGAISCSHSERVTRLLEEVVELAQAEGLGEPQAIDVVRRVFEKPAGDWRKEVGAVGVTLLAYCHSRQISAEEREIAEWERVRAINPATMRARHNAKADAGYALRAEEPDLPPRADCGRCWWREGAFCYLEPVERGADGRSTKPAIDPCGGFRERRGVLAGAFGLAVKP